MYLKKHPPIPTAVVFDAYGTLLSNTKTTKPVAQLREIIGGMGIDVSDYTQRAMTSRHTLSSLALSYGADVPLKTMARLDEELINELLGVEPYPDVERTLRYVMRRGAHVVIASNLAWPYSLPVHTLIDVVKQGGMINRTQISTAYSFDVGHIKPVPEFYSNVAADLESLSVEPQRIFMVGDRQIEDVDGPTRAGWRAWKVDRQSGQGLLDGPWDQWLG